MNYNNKLLQYVLESYRGFGEAKGSRSTKKLIPLHGGISKNVLDILGNNYIIHSQGIGDNKEVKVDGKYTGLKVDIGIENSNNKIVSGIGVKFMMNNYKQNAKNLYRNMLGETVDIRRTGMFYHQVLIVADTVPYFKKDGELNHFETITEKSFDDYKKLCNPDENIEVPNSTLLCVVNLPKITTIETYDDYLDLCKNLNKEEIVFSKIDFGNFGDSVFLNDFEKFLNSIVERI